jgi:hypothetical protein
MQTLVPTRRCHRGLDGLPDCCGNVDVVEGVLVIRSSDGLAPRASAFTSSVMIVWLLAKPASGLLLGTSSGARPRDSSIAALFAARTAAVGCSSDAAGGSRSARVMNTSLVSGTAAVSRRQASPWSSSGCRPGRSDIAALFAARKAAVGGRYVVARRNVP